MKMIPPLIDDGALCSAILQIAHDAIIAVDQDQKIVVFSRWATRIFGYESSEVIGKPLDILLPPRHSKAHRDHIQAFGASAAVVREMSERAEISGRRKDGTIFPAEASIAKSHHDGQTIFTVILRDITERKQAEASLREREAQYRHTLDNMLEGCQIIDFDWRYLYLNDVAAQQGRRAREELLGCTMTEVYPGIESTYMFEQLRRCMNERVPHCMVNEFVYPDGSKGWFELSFQPVPEGVFVLSNDITEQHEARERIRTQLQRLAALRAIDITITGSLDLRLSLNVVLEQTLAQLCMDAASVLLLNPHTQVLTYAAGLGFRTRAIEQTCIRPGEGVSGRAVAEGQAVHVHEPMGCPDFSRAGLLADEDFVEYYGTPLIAKGHTVGMLEVFHREPHEANEEWRTFLDTLAGQTAIAVDNAQLFQELQRSNKDLALAYDATIEGWSRALDLRDKETEGHTQRVAELTERLARAAGISEAELVHIRRGALLHDIGKMGVPDAILLKPAPLTDGEWEVMHRHPQLAFEMLAPIAFLRPALDIPYCHHERWDGSGYPRGLKGDQIPLSARLFAVVDAWDALRSDRPYRPAWGEEEVFEHIRSLAGTHFDPEAVEVFLRVMKEEPEER